MASVAPKCKKCKVEINKKDTHTYTKKSSGYYHFNCDDFKREADKLKFTTDKKCSYCKEGFTCEEDMVMRGSLALHPKCLETYREVGGEKMIKVRLRTCPKCNEKVNPLDENAYDTISATYHKDCYESIQREKKNRQDLYDYICLKYNIKFPTGFMLKQISEYHDTRGYSYKLMLMTLTYIFEVEKIPVLEDSGVGLIPHKVEKAKKYFRMLDRVGKVAVDATIDIEVQKVVAVRQATRRKKLIDLNNI